MSTNPANLADHALLSAAEEQHLARLIRAGVAARAELASAAGPRRRELLAAAAAGDAARERFVSSNLRLVLAFASRSRPGNMSYDDAVQDGNLGLLRAVDRFDPDAGCRFSTLAVFYIRQAVLRGADALRSGLRLSHTASELLTRLQRLIVEDPSASPATLAERLEITVEHVVDLLRVLDGPQQPAADAELAPVCPTPDPEASVISAMSSEVVRSLVGSLPTGHQEVLSARFGLDGRSPRSLAEVSAELGLSRDELLAAELAAYRLLRDQASALG